MIRTARGYHLNTRKLPDDAAAAIECSAPSRLPRVSITCGLIIQVMSGLERTVVAATDVLSPDPYLGHARAPGHLAELVAHCVAVGHRVQLHKL